MQNTPNHTMLCLTESSQYIRGPPKIECDGKNRDILRIKGILRQYCGHPDTDFYSIRSLPCEILIASATAQTLSFYPNEFVCENNQIFILGHISKNPILKKEKYINQSHPTIGIKEDWDDNAINDQIPSYVEETNWCEDIVTDTRSTLHFELIKERLPINNMGHYMDENYRSRLVVKIIEKSDGIFLYLYCGKTSNTYRAPTPAKIINHPANI